MVRRLLTYLVFAIAVHGQQTEQISVFNDPNATPEMRAADVVLRMTLDEKVLQMQDQAPAIPRLGIPAYNWWNEGLHGVARAGIATVFPQAIGMAATWDTELLLDAATAISTEARAKYNDAIQHGNHGRYFGLTFWSPNINIFRDPRWGRGQETYGEDPYLTSQMGAAFVKGMQGDDPNYLKVIATPKHFAVHSGPEPLRHGFNVNVDENDLIDTYLPAFKATVVEGHAYSVMCAYNSIDGVPACANPMLLKDRLRGAWNFQGFVTSDCGAIADILNGHYYRKTMAEAAAAAVKAGTDLTCGDEYKVLPEAVKNGAISEAEIDKSLERLFVARIRLGMFDPPERVPYSKTSMAEVASPGHGQIALRMARESMVLLKNDNGMLPLMPVPKHIAVLGPTADDPDALLGNYNGIPTHIVTPLAGLESEFAGKAQVSFALGSTYTDFSTALIPGSVLSPGGSQRGLRAEYFDNSGLNGKPVLSRIEPHGYLRWDMHDPAVTAHTEREKFSVRWSGRLKVTQSGDYQLGLTRLACAGCSGSDAAALFMDGKLLLQEDTRVSWNDETRTASIHLEAGRSHKFRVEYRQNRGGAGIELVWLPPAEGLIREARQKLHNADLAIVCVGLNSLLEGEESKVKIPGFSGGDRTDLGLPENQKKLLETAYASGKPVIVVLINGSALAVGSAKAHARAIVEAWYPGQEGGTAIAETLTGKNNPSGRLPVTFYESISQLPPFSDYSMQNRTYRYFNGTPLYPFGYGLSYSDFRYSDLSVEIDPSGIKINVKVSNSSSRDGDEVAELYLTEARNSRPAIRQLAGFRKIQLKAGTSQVLSFQVPRPSGGITKVSVGSGQPLQQWTGGRFVEKEL
jgi:beta-glucosidase